YLCSLNRRRSPKIGASDAGNRETVPVQSNGLPDYRRLTAVEPLPGVIAEHCYRLRLTGAVVAGLHQSSQCWRDAENRKVIATDELSLQTLRLAIAQTEWRWAHSGNPAERSRSITQVQVIRIAEVAVLLSPQLAA